MTEYKSLRSDSAMSKQNGTEGVSEDGDNKNRNKSKRLSQLLYPPLSIYETSFLTAGWIFIIGYSWYLVYVASRKHYAGFLSQDYLDEGLFSKFR